MQVIELLVLLLDECAQHESSRSLLSPALFKCAQRIDRDINRDVDVLSYLEKTALASLLIRLRAVWDTQDLDQLSQRGESQPDSLNTGSQSVRRKAQECEALALLFDDPAVPVPMRCIAALTALSSGEYGTAPAPALCAATARAMSLGVPASQHDAVSEQLLQEHPNAGQRRSWGAAVDLHHHVITLPSQPTDTLLPVPKALLPLEGKQLVQWSLLRMPAMLYQADHVRLHSVGTPSDVLKSMSGVMKLSLTFWGHAHASSSELDQDSSGEEIPPEEYGCDLPAKSPVDLYVSVWPLTQIACASGVHAPWLLILVRRPAR